MKALHKCNMPCFLVSVSVTDSKVMPCNRVRVEGNSKLKGTAQPFYSLNAPLIVHAPMIFQKQIRPVVRNMVLH